MSASPTAKVSPSDSYSTRRVRTMFVKLICDLARKLAESLNDHRTSAIVP